MVGEVEVILRAYRVCLDPNDAQLQALARHAGAARWGFNWALGEKKSAWQRQQQEIAYATYTSHAHLPADAALAAARKTIRARAELRVPSLSALSARFTRERGDEQAGIDGIFPWWRGINRHAIVHGMRCAEQAYANFFDSLSGKRAGRAVGFPRFKKKHRSRDAFTVFHDVTKPTIRVPDPRHLTVPNIGPIRLQGNLRRLRKKIDRDKAVAQSVTIAREGHRWFASVLVKESMEVRRTPTPRQRAGGTIGVDLGVKSLAALSDGRIIDNPRPLAHTQHRLQRAQRALARTQRGSARRAKAARRVGRLHAQVAERRAQGLHQLTKQLTTGHAVVAIEDLHVRGMTASARGTLAAPGRKVRQKAGLNRAILDASFGEVRRQLAYKTGWYGAQLAVIDRWAPTSKTCSQCGAIKDRLGLGERTYHCEHCGLTCDRDVNAARNIATAAQVKPTPGPESDSTMPDTSDKGVPEAQIGVARGGQPTHPRRGRSTKREGQHPPGRGSPPPSNRRALPNPNHADRSPSHLVR